MQLREFKKALILLLLLLLSSSCHFVKMVEKKAARFNYYEKVAVNLARENRKLKAQIAHQEHEIETLKSKNNYLTIKANNEAAHGMGGKVRRAPASIASMPSLRANDLVKQNIYKWSGKQLKATAEKEFQRKNFEKSAQFFQTFLEKNKKNANDQLYFQAGIAAFESGQHNDWVLENLGEIVRNYKKSKYYRGAKLWMALTYLKMGDGDKFYQTVEEFRKKYKNTPEWKILSAHYANIRKKYNK